MNSPTARFLAYAEAYLGAIRMWTPGASSLDPFERLRSLSGDDPISVSVVEIQLSLTAELAAWYELGAKAGYFSGGFPHTAALHEVGLANFVEDLASAGLSMGVDDVASFEASLVAALEDLNPDRLEFVRLIRFAGDSEFLDRFRELRAAVRRPSAFVSEDGHFRLGWALAGRDSSIPAVVTPARWRSDFALGSNPRMERVADAGAELATRVLVEHFGAEYADDIRALIARESRFVDPI